MPIGIITLTHSYVSKEDNVLYFYRVKEQRSIVKKYNKNKNFTPKLISAVLAIIITQPSFAQSNLPLNQASDEPQTSAGEIEVVLVTAQKRAFSDQLTPVALTAAKGETLRENGITSALDLNGLSPSLNVASSNGQLQLTMRGVGNEILLSGIGEAGIAMHSNGVYLGSNVTATAMFFDIERIEVMRGPQGTLWGRNSTGGAINVIQKLPTEEFEGFAAIDYGNYNSLDLEAAVSGSMSDNVQGRIAVKHTKKDGFLKNLAPGGGDLGDDNSISVRASINVYLDNGSWLLAAGHSDWDILGRSIKQEGTSFPSGSPTIFGLPGGLSFSEIAYGGSAPAGKFETYSTNPDAGEEANFEYFTSELNLDLNTANLTLLTDFRQHKRSYRVDGDFTPSDVESVFLNFTENAKEFSQEIRLTSTEDNLVNWVIGAYYYQQEIDLSTIVEWGAYPGIPDLLFGGAFGADYPRVGVNFGGTLDIKSVGLFGQSTITLNDRWAATLGLRYSSDKKNSDEYTDFLLGGIGGMSLAPDTGKFNEEWSDWTGKIGLEYKASKNTFVFSNISKGFKSGGINVGALSGAFDPEELYNYEIGVKSTMMGNRLRANATAYYSDFTGYQLQSVEGVNTIITNGDAEISGLEVELDYKPTADWLLSLVATFTDSEITAFTEQGLLNPATNAPIMPGQPTPRTPDSSYRVSVQKNFMQGDANTITARISYTWQDDVNLGPFGTSGANQSAFGLTDAVISWSANDGLWSADIYAKNLSNEFYKTGSYFYSIVLGSTQQAQIAEPRTYGIRFRRNF